MDFLEAVQEVEKIGYAYFYDAMGPYADEKIIADIQQDIRGTQLRALHYWEKSCDAFQLALDKSSDEDWKKFALIFGHPLYEVEEIRRLLTQLYEAMVSTIEERKLLS